MSPTTAIAWLTGLALVAPDLDPRAILGTALAMHVCEAITCRVLADGMGRSRSRWTLLGMIGGLWAVALLILLSRPAGTPSRRPVA